MEIADIERANQLLQFSNALDELCLSQKSFFSSALLSLLEKYFHYSDTSITVYTNDYKFCGGVAINGAKPLQEYYIKNKLYAWDTYSKYITQQCLNSDGLLPIMVNSRDHYKDGNYEESDYCNFLNKFGYSWTASMVFGNFRLNFHRSDADGGFSKEEMDFFKVLYLLLAARLKLYSRTQSNSGQMHCLDSIIASQSIGYIILNADWNVLHYNDEAVKFISSVTPNSNFRYAFKSLFEILRSDDVVGTVGKKGNHSFIYKNTFIVETSLHVQKREFDFTREFYLVTIKRISDSVSRRKVVDDLFKQKYGISEKEMDVIRCMATGLTYVQIAEKLYISINTVRSHIKNIYMKTNVNSQSNLLALYNQVERL